MTLRADIATGETTLDRTDLCLPGPIPLVLARSYRSGAQAGVFGSGWQHGLDRTLRLEPERVVYRDGAGRETVFAPVAVGMEARHPAGLTLQHHPDTYVVFASPLVQEVFRKGPGGVLRLGSIEDANGNRLALGYAGDRLTEITDPSGRRVRFVYAGALVSAIALEGADGQATPLRTFRYGAGGVLTAETDAAGQTTEYAYQGGLLVRVTDPAGATWLAQYDAERRCTALWRADGTDVRHLAYDPLRQTTRAVALDGRQTLYRHVLAEGGALVLEAVDAEGESLNYYYDEAQRLIGHAAPGGAAVTFQRLDPEAGTRVQIDHEHRFAEAQCGPSGLVETVADAFGNVFALGYDERFNLVRLTTPLGAVWAFERDRRGRPAALRSPAGRHVTFRRDGTALAVEDGEGLRLRLVTDRFGRLASRTDRLGRTQHFRYGPEGRLTGVDLDGGYRLGFDYDRAGRLTRLGDSERNELRRRYDPAGRLLSVESRHGATRFGYDPAGRILSAAGPTGEVRFGYDAQDRPDRAEGPRGTATFSYDGARVTVTRGGERRTYSTLGELLEEYRSDGSARTFEYGPSGELLQARRTRGGDEQSLLFEYDADGRLAGAELDGEHLAFAYDPDGLLEGVGADGLDLGISYDTRLRPAAVRLGEGVYRLAFDDGDRLVALHPPAGAAWTFRYDALDRLLGWQAGGELERRPAPGALDHVPVGEGGVRLVAATHGLALVVQRGALTAPLWGREEVRLRPLGLCKRLVRALVLGPEAALAPLPEDGSPLADRWLDLAAASVEGELPTAALGLPWPVLNLFALERRHYDPRYARRIGGGLPQHRPDPARSSDDVLTGSHRTGELAPRVWACRAVGSALADAPRLAPLPEDGGLPPDLALRLYRTLTQP